MSLITDELNKLISVATTLRDDADLHRTLEAIASDCAESIRFGGKIMFCGNGGSAGDSQHLAAELVGKLIFPRPAMPGLALTTDTSAITAIGNDFGYEFVFSRQVEGLGRQGDVLIGISTSGRSKNVLEAFKVAREKGIVTVGMTGGTGGDFPDYCDHLIVIPSSQTAKIQEGHIALGHIFCALVENSIHGGEQAGA
jgi:D-sedoheptulose 7-phosphate isomerase